MDKKKLIERWVPAFAKLINLDKLAEAAIATARDGDDALALLRKDTAPKRKIYNDATLLSANYSPVPFGFRDTQMDEFREWFFQDTKGEPRWRLITGEGGRGKTRFMKEFCATLQAESGRALTAGFLDVSKLSQSKAALMSFLEVKGDLLLVMDYAERFADEVKAVMLASLAIADCMEDRRIRLVFIARRESERWQEIRNSQEDIADFCYPEAHFQTFELPAVGDRGDDRRRVAFDQAFAAYCEHFGEDRPLPDAVALDDDAFDDFLMIHLSALAHYRGELPAGAMADERQLLDWVLRREESQHWIEIATGRKATKDLELNALREAAIVLTASTLGDNLATVAEGRERLKLCPLLADTSTATRTAVAEMFRDLYPGAGIGGIIPDRLGSNFLAKYGREVLAEAVAGFDPSALGHCLTKLTWAARNWPDMATPVIEAVIAAAPEKVLPSIIPTAIEAGDPIGRIAATWLAANPVLPETLTMYMFPQNTTALRELAAIVTRIELETLDPTDNSEDARSRRARNLNNLSVRLAELGHREEALTVIEEAVAIYRDLAGTRPDAFLPNLADSLNNLSVLFSNLGRLEEGLAVIEEAVAIYRDLAAARPDAFLPDLAMSLNNVSVLLSNLRRLEEGLAVIEEAVAIYRDLAAARLDVFLPDLAMSLNTLSIRFSYLGRHEEGLATIEEAVAIRRDLAAARPDAFLPDLADSLNNLSNRFSYLGRPEEGLAAIEEAIAIDRDLAAARPDAFLPVLADSLNNLSLWFSDLGRPEEGLAAIEEAVAIRRDLAAARPGAFLPDLATSLSVLGDRYGELGRWNDAASVKREAVERLAKAFLARPLAHAVLMRLICRDYVVACDEAGVAVDDVLLGPIKAALQKLEQDDGGADS